MRYALIVVFALALTGCATAPNRYGTHTSIDVTNSSTMAKDAAMQLAHLFPPAINRFNIDQDISKDPFGKTLLNELRSRGYAVSNITATANGHTVSVPYAGAPLEYLITGQGTKMVYLTIYVGSQLLSRSYVIDNHMTYAGGAWAHKE